MNEGRPSNTVFAEVVGYGLSRITAGQKHDPGALPPSFPSGWLTRGAERGLPVAGGEAGPSTDRNSHTEKPTLPTWAQAPEEDLGHQIIHVL